MFCGNCGANNVSGAAFCEKCGYPLASGDVAKKSTNPLFIVIPIAVAVIIAALLVWLLAFGGLKNAPGQGSILDSLRNNLLGISDIKEGFVSNDFVGDSDYKITDLKIVNDEKIGDGTEDGKKYEDHYVEFSGTSENDYFRSNFNGSTHYVKKDNESSFSDTVISGSKTVPIKDPDGKKIDDPDNPPTSSSTEDKVIEKYWFGKKVHTVTTNTKFDPDKGWVEDGKPQEDKTDRYVYDIKGNKLVYRADLMSSWSEHSSKISGSITYSMIVHSECVPSIEVEFQDIDDEGNAKATLCIKQSSKNGDERQFQAYCSSEYNLKDKGSVSFDDIDSTVEISGKIQPRGIFTVFEATGEPKGNFHTIDGEKASLSFTVNDTKEDSGRFTLFSNLRYHTGNEADRPFCFDRMLFDRVDVVNNDESSTKTDDDNQQFSWMQTYNGKTYVGSYSSAMPNTTKCELGDGYEKLPVNSSTFKIINDKIYYLSQDDSQGITPSTLRMCDLDGSHDKELIKEDNTAIITPYSFNEKIYFKKQIIGSESDDDWYAVDAEGGSASKIGGLDNGEEFVGFTDDYVWTQRIEDTGTEFKNTIISRYDKDFKNRKEVLTLTSGSMAMPFHKLVGVTNDALYVRTYGTSTGVTFNEINAYDFDGNEKDTVKLGDKAGSEKDVAVIGDDDKSLFVIQDSGSESKLSTLDLETYEVSFVNISGISSGYRIVGGTKDAGFFISITNNYGASSELWQIDLVSGQASKVN